MSKLALANGDDHPDAAAKHLADSAALLSAARADGAAYLSGYVVECSLKSIYQLQTGSPLHGHAWPTLHAQAAAVASVAGAKTAKYLGPATQSVLAAAIASWKPGLRYEAASISVATAHAWHLTATQVFGEVIAQMSLDGEL
jgi:hypothetical protein